MRWFLRVRSLRRLPRLLRLSLLLLHDPRVPLRSKVLTLSMIALVISPLDLPGWIPLVGQGLDVILIVAILDRFVRAAPDWIVREDVSAHGLRGHRI